MAKLTRRESHSTSLYNQKTITSDTIVVAILTTSQNRKAPNVAARSLRSLKSSPIANSMVGSTAHIPPRNEENAAFSPNSAATIVTTRARTNCSNTTRTIKFTFSPCHQCCKDAQKRLPLGSFFFHSGGCFSSRTSPNPQIILAKNQARQRQFFAYFTSFHFL